MLLYYYNFRSKYCYMIRQCFKCFKGRKIFWCPIGQLVIYNAPQKPETEIVNYNGSMNKRNHYSVEYKTKVVLEVCKKPHSMRSPPSTVSSPVMLSRWKQEFLERAPETFKKGASDSAYLT